ncbi:recombinase family protein [Kitasatospora sp. NPDC058965]|uniref:recombinase family protein n=1 Tax=Kitasatospora sp. NPDC058965 TaxID=3346682 RepID=UPI0036AEAF36
MRWIFSQRLAGHSLARITRALNDTQVPPPSAADPDRNPHRDGRHWQVPTVRAILANPRYTGRQVWNRQRTDHELIDPDNTTLGHRDVMRWNTPDDWAISHKQAHPALVSEADFVAAQHIRVTREATPGRTYQLAGILHCGLCSRRMDSHWTHQRPGYRCRHGHTSASTPSPTDRATHTCEKTSSWPTCRPSSCASQLQSAMRPVSRPPPSTPSSTCAPKASR